MKKYKLHKILLDANSSSNTAPLFKELIGSGYSTKSGKSEKKLKNVCSDFPDLPSIVNSDRSIINRIIAVGDIHGDLDLAINCLLVAKVIKQIYINKNKENNIEETDILYDDLDFDEIKENEYSDNIVKLNYKEEKIPRFYKWIGEKTIVVQVGDQVDRCRPIDKECHDPNATINDEGSDIKIMFFFHDLHLVALKSGCAVYSLLGNHELLNVLGTMRYVSYKGLEEFKSADDKDIFEGRKKAFDTNSTSLLYKKKTNLSNFLACARLSAIIVDSYLFVHAGVLDKLISHTAKHSGITNKTHSIETINHTIRAWLTNTSKKTDKDYIEKLLSGKTLSPFWPRIFGNLQPGLERSNKLCQHHVEPVLKFLDIKGLVVGHTPQLKMNINSTCGDTVWRVDIAGSQAFDEILYINTKSDNDKKKITQGRKPQVLEIKLGKTDEKDIFTVLLSK